MTTTQAPMGAPLRPVPAPRNRYAHLIASSRGSRGWSRAELAAELGVPEATLALWEDPAYEGIDLPILERVGVATGLRLEISFARPRERSKNQDISTEGVILERTA